MYASLCRPPRASTWLFWSPLLVSFQRPLSFVPRPRGERHGRVLIEETKRDERRGARKDWKTCAGDTCSCVRSLSVRCGVCIGLWWKSNTKTTSTAGRFDGSEGKAVAGSRLVFAVHNVYQKLATRTRTKGKKKKANDSRHLKRKLASAQCTEIFLSMRA